jgi:APA family basic amino acid/polyamine antiporter
MSHSESEEAVILPRRLGFLSATALVVSNMIGTGIFTTAGFMAADLGDSKLILAAWILGAFLALAGALCYSELAINFPKSGGEYVYLTQAFGPTWGFMTGWVSFFAGFSAPVAAAALGFAHYLAPLYPTINHPQLVACALILLFTFINCIGISRAAFVQNALTSIKVLVLLTFVIGGFLLGHGHWQNLSTTTTRTSTTSLPVQFIISLVWVMVGYSGWNAATYVAEEIKNPKKVLPAALAVGTTIVAVLYIAMNTLFIYSTPLSSMKGVLAIGTLSAINLFGRKAATGFGILMAISIMSTVSAMVMIGPRVTYAMARDGVFFRWAAKLHPRFKTPVAAVLAQGVCAMLMTFTRFPELMFYIGLSLTFFTVAAVTSIFVFRRRPDWQKLPAMNFGFPLILVAYIFIGLCMMIYGMIWQPFPSSMAALTIFLGACTYKYLRLET